MKNIFKRSLILTIALAFGACNELDLVNPNAATEDSFWKTENDLWLGVVATYDQLQDFGMYGLDWRVFPQMLADDGTNEAPWEFNDLARFIQEDLNQWGNFWGSGYQLIGRAYQVIDRSVDIQGSEVPRLVGEAKFMVALGYYGMLTGFGDKIAYVDGIQGPEEKPRQAETGELWNLTEQYLSEAITVLPLASEIPESEYGRVSKGAAQAYLAKVHLQQGDYAAAEPLLAEVINSNQYDLLPDYSDNFRETNTVNPEAVFVVNFLHAGVEGESDNNIHFKFNAPSETRGHYGDVQATNFVLNSLLAEQDKDGNNDPRTDVTVFWPGSQFVMNGLTHAEWVDEAPPFNPDNVLGYYKYSESEFIGDREAIHKDGGIDYILIRYSDVLLLYAETLNQMGQTAAAYQYVDMVRERSNMNPLSNVAPGLSQTDFHEQIKHERMTELAGEGVRFWDMKRWGDYGPQAADDFFIPALNVSVKRDPNFATFTTGQDELWAIPLDELDLNENLIQNPGY